MISQTILTVIIDNNITWSHIYYTHSNHRQQHHMISHTILTVTIDIWTTYIQGIGNRNSCMNIACPITISTYLSTITVAFFPSSLSFKYLLCGVQIVKTLTHMTLLVSNTIHKLNTELHAPVKYSLHTKGITSDKDLGQWACLQFNLKH